MLHHKITEDKIHPGMHIYCHRVGGLYQHHGISVSPANLSASELDFLQMNFPNFNPNNENIIVVHQTTDSLQITPISAFLNGSKPRAVKYGCNPVEYSLKRSGTCQKKQKLPDQEVENNALSLFRHKIDWKKYSLLFKNCEHFATSSSLGISICEQLGILSKIPEFLRVVSNFVAIVIKFISKGLMNGLLLESVISGIDEILRLPIFRGNIITQSIIFVLQSIQSTIRFMMWIYYHHYSAKAPENEKLYSSCLPPEIYLEKLSKTTVANGASLLFSIVGSLIVPPPFSQLLSFILGLAGYAIGLIFGGVLFDLAHKLVKTSPDLD